MSKYDKGLFIYPYRTDPWVAFGKLPPIGLEIVAAAVRDFFEQIEIVDMRFDENLDRCLEGAQVVCISIPWGRERGVAGKPLKKYDIDFVHSIIRRIPRDRTLILGGTYAVESKEYLFENFENIDILIKGQGEETLRELLSRGSPKDVQGLFYRGESEIIENPDRPIGIVPNLYPDRSLRKYKYTLFGSRIDTIYTSHGCPYRCTYCEFEGLRWHGRSAEDIFEEIKSLGPETKYVLINDNNFLEDPDRAIKLIDLMKENGIKKTFWAQCRSTPIARRQDLVDRLNSMGFVLAMGIESAQDHVLKWLRKGYTKKTNDKALESLKHTSVVIQAYYIIGNYLETREEMLDIIDYSHNGWIDFICMNRLRCYPQSRLAKIIEETEGIYVDRQDLRVWTDKVSKDELTDICKYVTRKFYLSKTLFRTLCKMSFHFDLSYIARFAFCSFINIYLFKSSKKMTAVFDRILGFFLFRLMDRIFNSFLRLTGRVVYGIKV
ncbi:MAG: radical SAM protein [Acidobacteriota bacterium]